MQYARAFLHMFSFICRALIHYPFCLVQTPIFPSSTFSIFQYRSSALSSFQQVSVQTFFSLSAFPALLSLFMVESVLVKYFLFSLYYTQLTQLSRVFLLFFSGVPVCLLKNFYVPAEQTKAVSFPFPQSISVSS